MSMVIVHVDVWLVPRTSECLRVLIKELLFAEKAKRLVHPDVTRSQVVIH